jgi:hypothetical protein
MSIIPIGKLDINLKTQNLTHPALSLDVELMGV